MPPKTSCWVWTKNSISRMPPRPSLMSWPATAIVSCPRTAWICRFIAWMSAMAAKSKYLRQMNGARSSQERLADGQVAGNRPRLDQRRALPVLADGLVIGEGGRQRDGRRAWSAGSGRSLRSVRKT